MSGFELHIKYNVLPNLRKGDNLIMEFATKQGVNKEDLLSMSRVRGSLRALFMSNIVTADGKFLEEFTSRALKEKKSRFQVHVSQGSSNKA